MSIKKAVLRKLGVAVSVDRNEVGEMDVLVHKEARHHAAHGYIVASNRALNIKGGTVAVVLPDFDEAPLLTPRFMLDLQEALHAKGWTLSHVAAWEGVQHFTAQGPSGSDEHATAYNVTPSDRMESVSSRPHEIMREDADVPAFLRKSPTVNLQELARAHRPTGEGVLRFPRREDGLNRPLFSDNPNVARLVEAAQQRVADLDDMAREAAKVRFEAIASNALSTGQSHEYIRDKLEVAVNVIIGAHEQTDAATAVQH
jgi:hypothetical protein